MSGAPVAWPNKLGFDVGHHEVWHWRSGETVVRLFRDADASSPYFCAMIPKGHAEPTDAVIEAFRKYAARPTEED
jgi:hypothetical protein